MTRFITAALLMLVATQATALSCVRPEIAQTFRWLDGRAERYVVAYGQIAYDTTRNVGPVQDRTAASSMTSIPGRFTGVILQEHGFSDPISHDIAVNIVCTGPWCGFAQDTDDTLSFVRIDGPDWHLDADPCGGTQFQMPTPAQIDMVQACLRGESCRPQPLQ